MAPPLGQVLCLLFASLCSSANGATTLTVVVRREGADAHKTVPGSRGPWQSWDRGPGPARPAGLWVGSNEDRDDREAVGHGERRQQEKTGPPGRSSWAQLLSFPHRRQECITIANTADQMTNRSPQLGACSSK